MNATKILKTMVQLPLLGLKLPLPGGPRYLTSVKEHEALDQALPTPDADEWLDKMFSTQGMPNWMLTNSTGPR